MVGNEWTTSSMGHLMDQQLLFCNIHGKFTIKPRMPWYHIILSSVIWASPAKHSFPCKHLQIQIIQKKDPKKIWLYVYKNSFHPISVQTSHCSKVRPQRKLWIPFPENIPLRWTLPTEKIILHGSNHIISILPFLSAAHKQVHKLMQLQHVFTILLW